jgi:hypothetical protein
VVLATVPADQPQLQFWPYIGDYDYLMAVGKDFYGVFSANNTPDESNFPRGVHYQRNHDFKQKVLFDLDNKTKVDASIDPFFFHAHEILEDSSMEELIADAQFVFRGKVEKVSASNLEEVKASDRTAVVKVEKILRAPPALAKVEGQDVTVELPQGAGLKPNDDRIFFTNGWLYSTNIAVQAVGSVEGTQQEKVQDAIGQHEDDVLQKHLATADLVISGRVTGIQEVPRDPKQPISEHEPELEEATVEVQSVEKGDLAEKPRTIQVKFVASKDVRWVALPKLTKGEEAVLALHKDYKPTGMQAAIQGYSVVAKMDVQPKAQLDRIRKLLKKPR